MSSFYKDGKPSEASNQLFGDMSIVSPKNKNAVHQNHHQVYQARTPFRDTSNHYSTYSYDSDWVKQSSVATSKNKKLAEKV